MILYIHGFRTTKNSYTSKLLKKYFKKDIILADHPTTPKEAIKYLEDIIENNNITSLIASSLGGYYATYLSEKYGLKTVLINPSVHPFRTTKTYLGQNTTQDGVKFIWKKKSLKQLEKFKIKQKQLHSQRFYLFLQKADKVLNYKVALKRYPKAKKQIEKEGSHRFEDLERHLKSIFLFINK
ncbi:MAG: YqiA/YcfP family alpha/beta fold hydrolase [Arcobacteraceae bacterium]